MALVRAAFWALKCAHGGHLGQPIFAQYSHSPYEAILACPQPTPPLLDFACSCVQFAVCTNTAEETIQVLSHFVSRQIRTSISHGASMVDNAGKVMF